MVGSLFAGIGGFDLGLERAGFEIAWQIEIDDYCQRVLAKHWPHVTRYGDIKSIDWGTLPAVDLMCGGFPCQPFSLAGQRRGTADDRYLWPAMLSGIQQLQPTWIIGENVPGLVGPVLDTVLSDLEATGYEVQTLAIPACAFDAPHIRQRLWIIAHHASAIDGQSLARSVRGQVQQSGECSESPALADTECERRQAGTERSGWTERADVSRRSAGADVADASQQLLNGSGNAGARRRAQFTDSGEDVSNAHQFNDDDGRYGTGEVCGERSKPAELCRGKIHLGDTDKPSSDAYATQGRSRGAASEPSRWEPEPELGRVAHGIPHRVDRLRGLGNAIVPHIAEWLGRQIMNIERSL